MANSIQYAMIPALRDVLVQHAGVIVANALTSIETENAVQAAILEIAQTWVVQHGHEVASELIDDLISAVHRDGSLDVPALPRMSASEFSKLTEALQASEAAEWRRNRKWARQLAAVLQSAWLILRTAVPLVLT